MPHLDSRPKVLLDLAAQYPVARREQRVWHAFLGPTNSGKSYRAFDALAGAASGIYLAPLRLLAMEGQAALEARGVPTTLRTGDFRVDRPAARHTAATVEMLNTLKPVEVGVIDEVQLVRDPARGWAWVQALLGMPAEEVYLTGSPDILPTLTALAEHVGVTLNVTRTTRLAALHVLSAPTRLKEVRPATAIVAFGRRQTLELRTALEARGYRVAVIYGALTPAVRAAEAARFCSGEAQVLVATDAIALGLNLHIETVLFAATTKFDGASERPLTDNEIRQIGGRAGRYGQFPMGYVGTLEGADLRRVQRAMAAPLTDEESVAPVAARPTRQTLLHYARTMTPAAVAAAPGEVAAPRLLHVLASFPQRHTPFSSLFTLGFDDDLLDLAAALDEVTLLPLPHKLMLAAAPLDRDTPPLKQKLLGWAWAVATKRVVRAHTIRHRADLGVGWAHSDADLVDAEQHAQLLLLYAWLHHRLPTIFPDGPLVQTYRERVDGYIRRTLRRPTSTWFRVRPGTTATAPEDALIGGNGVVLQPRAPGEPSRHKTASDRTPTDRHGAAPLPVRVHGPAARGWAQAARHHH